MKVCDGERQGVTCPRRVAAPTRDRVWEERTCQGVRRGCTDSCQGISNRRAPVTML
ncbi:hypothetical protein F4558_002021 [Micromonospora profundi]|nr:hypothetical protein [Micromonospora profundi]